MIIPNGTMQPIRTARGGFDSNGNPVAVVQVIEDPIPVRISGSRRKESEASNGSSYTSASYEVLCDDTTFSAMDVILKNKRGSRMGIFRVKDVQYLDSVDATKIVCEQYGE